MLNGANQNRCILWIVPSTTFICHRQDIDFHKDKTWICADSSFSTIYRKHSYLYHLPSCTVDPRTRATNIVGECFDTILQLRAPRMEVTHWKDSLAGYIIYYTKALQKRHVLQLTLILFLTLFNWVIVIAALLSSMFLQYSKRDLQDKRASLFSSAVLYIGSSFFVSFTGIQLTPDGKHPNSSGIY